MHALLTSKPSIAKVKFMYAAYPGAACVRTHQGNYPLMIACESAASLDVIIEMLKVYPDLVGR